MRRTAILLIGFVAAAVATARALLKDRSDQDHDEIDLAAVAASRRIRMRAKPFIGATILVAVATVELDLRRVHPAPTGVEIAVMMFGGLLRVVTPPGWEVVNSVKPRATRFCIPVADTAEDAPVIRLEGSAWLSRIEIIQRSVPVAVAS
ncbi:MAG TPA: hypothetical protein VM848_01720 [Acidimicrobiia bacterium]|nr:hypothetical protein [Acidimicrobiia bacterium]